MKFNLNSTKVISAIPVSYIHVCDGVTHILHDFHSSFELTVFLVQMMDVFSKTDITVSIDDNEADIHDKAEQCNSNNQSVTSCRLISAKETHVSDDHVLRQQCVSIISALS